MNDTSPECALTGTIVAIAVGRYGVDLSIVPVGSEATVQPPTWGNFTCRLDPSMLHLPLMLDIAKTAMRDGLLVWVGGFEDDGVDRLRIHDLRVFQSVE